MGAEHLAHHFEDLDKQAHAARLGMWIFLATEVLLFGGLFAAYAAYRSIHGAAFAAASAHLDRLLGTACTLVLITSSLTMALAIHLARHRREVLAVLALGATMALGVAFLALHGTEYLHEARAGALPGRFYALRDLALPGAPMFFTLYFFMTGLHSLHVLIGVLLLGWLTVRTGLGHFSASYDTPLELGGLYWHLVDLIWIFLYPLLYLV